MGTPSPRLVRKLLAQGHLVASDDTLGGRQDVARGAVVLYKVHRLGIGVVVLEAKDVPYVGIAPRIDGLVWVPHHADIPVPARHLLRQLVLHHIGVLELIDHHVLEARLIPLQGVCVLPKQLYRFQQQVVEVHGIVAVQQLLVALVGPGGPLLEVVGWVECQSPGVDHCALGLGDDPLHRAPREALAVEVGHLDGLLQHTALVVVVVNGEAWVQTNMMPVPAQHAHTEGMEGGHADLFGFRPSQPVETLPHLPRRPVGEGDGKYPIRPDAMAAHQVGNAVGDNPRLAAAGACHDKQRALGGLHCFTLRRVQSVQ